MEGVIPDWAAGLFVLALFAGFFTIAFFGLRWRDTLRNPDEPPTTLKEIIPETPGVTKYWWRDFRWEWLPSLVALGVMFAGSIWFSDDYPDVSPDPVPRVALVVILAVIAALLIERVRNRHDQDPYHNDRDYYAPAAKPEIAPGPEIKTLVLGPSSTVTIEFHTSLGAFNHATTIEALRQWVEAVKHALDETPEHSLRGRTYIGCALEAGAKPRIEVWMEFERDADTLREVERKLAAIPGPPISNGLHELVVIFD